MKCIATSTTGYTLLPDIYKNSVPNLMLKSLLPNEAKVTFTIDDTRRNSSLDTNRALNFLEKSFVSTIIGFTQSHSQPLDDAPRRFVEMIPGSYKGK